MTSASKVRPYINPNTRFYSHRYCLNCRRVGHLADDCRRPIDEASKKKNIRDLSKQQTLSRLRTEICNESCPTSKYKNIITYFAPNITLVERVRIKPAPVPTCTNSNPFIRNRLLCEARAQPQQHLDNQFLKSRRELACPSDSLIKRARSRSDMVEKVRACENSQGHVVRASKRELSETYKQRRDQVDVNSRCVC